MHFRMGLVGVALLWGAAACGDSGPDKGAGSLGIDDGASAGVSTSALVTGEEEVVMKLKTGAQVKIPEGAVDKEVESSG